MASFPSVNSGGSGGSGDTTKAVVSQALTLNDKTIEQKTVLEDGTEIDSSVVLDYLSDDEVQTKADTAEQAAKNYTDEEIAKIPDSGGVSIDLPNDTIPIIKDNKLVDSGLTAVDGSISTKPSSVYIGKDKYSSGGLSSFISDTSSNNRYRIIRQNTDTGIIEYVKNVGVQTSWVNANDKLGTIVYPNESETPIDLPQNSEFITILENSIFKFELKSDVTSDLIVELLELGQVISTKNVGTVSSGIIETNLPETDLRTDGVVEIRFHQKNGESVEIAGTLNSPYAEFEFKTFEVGSLATGGGSDGNVDSVTVSYDEGTRELTVNVDGITGAAQLDFIDAFTLAETQEASLQQAKEYTDSNTIDEVRHTIDNNTLKTEITLENGNIFSDSVVLPSGGSESQFGVTEAKIGTIIGLADPLAADSSMLLCDGKQYLKSDYPELYNVIKDTYQSVDTEPDSFNVPRIENTKNVDKLADLSFDHLLNEYLNGLNPTEQQMAGILVDDRVRFVFSNNNNIILGTTETDKVDGLLIGAGYQYVDRFALAYENNSIHVLGFHLDKVYHSVVVEGEVTQSMIESTSPFHNPLFVVYMENANALIAVDRDRSGAILVKAVGTTLKENGEIDFDEDRKDSIAFPSDVTPLNLCCTAAEGQGFRAVTVAGSDGHTHVFPLESFFLLFESNTLIENIQITGISQAMPHNVLGTNTQYTCTDNKALYTIHMGTTHQDNDTAYLEFHRNIVDPTDTKNLSQPFVRDGTSSFKKICIDQDTGYIRVRKSELDNVDFITQDTTHYIKAFIDYTQSPIVETVTATYNNNQLTVNVNGIDSEPVTISSGSGEDPRVETLLGQVQALEILTQQQTNTINDLQESLVYLQKNSFSSYELYSGAVNRLDVRMQHIDGTTDDDVQSVTLDGNYPDPTDPDVPTDAKTYTVWHGWSKNSIDELNELEFKNTSDQERTETSKIYGDGYTGSILNGEQHILDARYENTRPQPQNIEDAAYMYLVFPREITNQEIKHVNYNGSTADWRSRDITVDGIAYRIYMTDEVNIAPIYDLGLST